MRLPMGNGTIKQSLFDRLTDLEPRSKNDLPSSSSEQSKELKNAIARDLTSLLNVRLSEADIPAEFEEVGRSIAAYGMQDFSASPVEKEQVRRGIEKCIRIFEPRLSHVTVSLTQNVRDRLEFHISCTVEIERRSEPIVFDATIPVHSRRFQINEGR